MPIYVQLNQLKIIKMKEIGTLENSKKNSIIILFRTISNRFSNKFNNTQLSEHCSEFIFTKHDFQAKILKLFFVFSFNNLFLRTAFR